MRAALCLSFLLACMHAEDPSRINLRGVGLKKSAEVARESVAAAEKLADQELAEAELVKIAEEAAKAAAPMVDPKTGLKKLRGALIYLISPDKNENWGFEEDAELSMQCSRKFIGKPLDYDTLAFHTMSEEKLAKVKKSVPFVKFIRIEFDWPDAINEEWLADGRCMLDGVDYWAKSQKCGCTCPDIPDRPESSTHCWGVNYLHMNRFFTYKLWTMDWTKDYDYFMRIDADLFIQDFLPEDPFRTLDDRGCVFGTNRERSEIRGCFEGQHEETLAWATQAQADGMKGLHIENLDKIRPNSVYWGGWHVGSVKVLKSEQHLSLANHLNENGGIFTHRWNDQVHFPKVAALMSPLKDDEQATGGKSVNTCMMPMFGMECFTPPCEGINHIFIHEHQKFKDKLVQQRCEMEDVDVDPGHDEE